MDQSAADRHRFHVCSAVSARFAPCQIARNPNENNRLLDYDTAIVSPVSCHMFFGKQRCRKILSASRTSRSKSDHHRSLICRITMSSVVENSAILPGENVIDFLESCKDNHEKPTVVGPGLKRKSKDKITSHTAGQLLHRNGNLFWINSHQRYYIPCERDTVIGVVTSKTASICRVDIGASEQATLSLFAFPNATKRNKGIVDIGDIIFARVLTAAKDIETELVCVDQHGKKDGLGVLQRGGYMIKVPINICRRLLAPDSKISELLGQKYRFEKAIGINGRIWIRARALDTTILLSNFIKQLEYIPNFEQIDTCNLLCK